jgi:hypothetical protein
MVGQLAFIFPKMSIVFFLSLEFQLREQGRELIGLHEQHTDQDKQKQDVDRLRRNLRQADHDQDHYKELCIVIHFCLSCEGCRQDARQAA